MEDSISLSCYCHPGFLCSSGGVRDGDKAEARDGLRDEVNAQEAFPDPLSEGKGEFEDGDAEVVRQPKVASHRGGELEGGPKGCALDPATTIMLTFSEKSSLLNHMRKFAIGRYYDRLRPL